MKKSHRSPEEHVRVRKSSGRASLINEGVHYDDERDALLARRRNEVMSKATVNLSDEVEPVEFETERLDAISELPVSGVVRGEGREASAYYLGEEGVVLTRKPGREAKVGYGTLVGMNSAIIGAAGVTAAIGLLPVSAALLAYAANISPTMARATRELRRNYKEEEAVSAKGVDVVETFDAHEASPHHGFIPVEDIASVRVYRADEKTVKNRHTGVEVVRNDGSVASLSFSRQPNDQYDLVAGLAKRMGEILDRPVEKEMRVYTSKEMDDARAAMGARRKTLFRMIFQRKKYVEQWGN